MIEKLWKWHPRYPEQKIDTCYKNGCKKFNKKNTNNSKCQGKLSHFWFLNLKFRTFIIATSPTRAVWSFRHSVLWVCVYVIQRWVTVTLLFQASSHTHAIVWDFCFNMAVMGSMIIHEDLQISTEPRKTLWIWLTSVLFLSSRNSD